MTKTQTGAPFLDTFLSGGYDSDIITTIYGPSGSGKTNLCLIAAVHCASLGKKVIFLDTEGGIAVERIKQICPEYEKVLERMLFFNPMTFEEQKKIFDTLREMVNEQIGMIIVDSVSMLYRLELGKNEEVYEVNSALGRQIAYLVEIARRKKIPVLLTTQVYADFDHRDQVKIVGGDLLKYGSKCLLELVKLNNSRGIVLRKHRSMAEGKELRFKIVKEGIEEV
ncbi:MAG: DNA repair and recombination protein RadB [Nanoarchaeota archaeon]|nr:DNA repair and recombination protein RadB [Nanoarchaeota archaeon]